MGSIVEPSRLENASKLSLKINVSNLMHLQDEKSAQKRICQDKHAKF